MNELRDLLFPYKEKKDREDMTAMEKLTDNFVYRAASGVGALFLGMRTIMNSFQYKNISIPVVQEAQELIEVFSGEAGLFNTIQRLMDAQEEGDTAAVEKNAARIGGQMKKAALSVAMLFGLPLRQVEKYLVKGGLRAFGGQASVEKYNAALGYGTEPSSNYDDLSIVIREGNERKAKQYIEAILHKGGNLKNFLNAKSGGGKLNQEQRNQIMDLWLEVEMKIELDEKQNQE